MCYRLGWLVALCLLTVGQAQTDAGAKPRISRFIAPIYPPLARLANIQGRLTVNYVLDDECHILNRKVVSGSPVILETAILRTIMNGDVGLQFGPCEPGQPRHLTMYFDFILRGDPTNKWTPTHVLVRSVTDGYDVEIVTQPGDLHALGLTKKGRLR